MKKKKWIAAGVTLLVIVVAVVAITLPPTWSNSSFEAIVQEIVTTSDGEARLIVQRTTKIFGAPMNSLYISENTKLFGADGKAISIGDIQPQFKVKVSLKDSFVEETPFYYPTVYEVRVLDAS